MCDLVDIKQLQWNDFCNFHLLTILSNSSYDIPNRFITYTCLAINNQHHKTSWSFHLFLRSAPDFIELGNASLSIQIIYKSDSPNVCWQNKQTCWSLLNGWNIWPTDKTVHSLR